MISILHPIHRAIKAFGRRATRASARTKALRQKRTSTQCPFADGCQRNGKAVSRAALSAIFTGPEKIQSWKVHPVEVHCTFRTGESTMFRFEQTRGACPEEII